MALNHLRDVSAGKTVAAAQCLEKARHGLWVEPRGREKADANAVRLVFVGARKIDLLLSSCALRDRNGALHRIATPACHCAHQDCRENGRCRSDALLALRADGARNVTLRDVRD